MNRKVFKVNPELCVGCRLCELMCSLLKSGSFNPAQARLKVAEDLEHGRFQPIICRHCKVPKCQEACPTNAIVAHPLLPGVVVLNEKDCIGCLACVDACPFGAIQVGPNQEILKCDLCDGDPACVRHCYKTPANSSPYLPYPAWKALEYTDPHLVNELKIIAEAHRRSGRMPF